jgi:hypothetical protein
VEKGDIVERGIDINEEGPTNKVFIDLENAFVVFKCKTR